MPSRMQEAKIGWTKVGILGQKIRLEMLATRNSGFWRDCREEGDVVEPAMDERACTR